jgi:hypothetical protein
MAKPATLLRDISPPPTGRTLSKAPTEPSKVRTNEESNTNLNRENVKQADDPSLAAIEAGKVEIQGHLEYFSEKLASVRRPTTNSPLHSIEDYKKLYRQNQHEHGRHFVVHQHDHPVSGVHYDLRLQFSETSAISFAIPYGLPGNPNSLRPHRMAVETRVHCLWNNLIESASHATGSLVIWDTGEYEILPRKAEMKAMTDDESSDAEAEHATDARSDSERLFSAFQDRHIRLRLHGKRLPQNYTIGLRLPSKNDRAGQPRKPKSKRRRLDPSAARNRSTSTLTDSEADENLPIPESRSVDETEPANDAAANASDKEEDVTIRSNNAYPGAINSIGSVHQRHWFLSLDRRRSGFTKARSGADQGGWVGPWEPFFVRGRDCERSVVTGRSADEVMEDEVVEKFVGRKMWRAVLE